MTRRRILFVAEGVTLAHVGRAIFLAGTLPGDDVEIACPDDYAYRVREAGLRRRPLRSLAPATFAARLARGQPVYTQDELAAYVRDDLQLLAAIRPDAVVGDFRLSLSVSARLAKVPYVNVTNAYWSPYARPDFQMPGLRAARWIPPAIGDRIFRMLRPLAFAVHARPMNRLRRAHGLKPLRSDVREVYCDGDATLYTDIPQLIPTPGASATHAHIGPVAWSPAIDLPAWWDEATAGPPPIYVSLGSSGAADALPMIVDAVRPLGCPIVVATAARAPQLRSTAGVFVADFVPGERVAARSCVVVCNGGSPATLQALANGVPVIGIASNLDQFLNMGYVERVGAGTLLRADRAKPGAVRSAVAAAIEDSTFRLQARVIAEWARLLRPETAFPAAIARLIGAQPGPHEGCSRIGAPHAAAGSAG
jgi:UDP:flavonoid glycosyltransferase YjiC (YdhE family)